MVSYLSSFAALLAALGLCLIGLFLNRMVKPFTHFIAHYCESKAVRSVRHLAKHLIDSAEG